MKLRARRLLGIIGLVAAALLAIGAGVAPAPAPPPPPQPPGALPGPALGEGAYQLYKDNKLITARTKAQAALDADPDSVLGNYVMGCVMREAEGVLPRAMYHLGHARQVFEQRFGSPPRPEAPWRFHEEMLFAIVGLAGEMEEYGYQLEMLDYHDALYDPDLHAEHAWTLLHLGKFPEARESAKKAIGSRDKWQQSLGKNALCAIEGEAREREPYYKACLAALENAKAEAAKDKKPVDATGVASDDPTLGTAVAVHYYNTAHAAYSVLRYDEVERLAKDATRRPEFTIANPWRLLTRYYTDAGRVSEAVGAVREMQRWRVRNPAMLRDQDRAETDMALASLLLVAGEAEAGLRLATRAVERPDRRGLVSSNPEQAIGASALARRALMRLSAELASERASVSGTVKRGQSMASAIGKRVSSWPDDERIAAIMADDRRLDSTFRLFLSGGIEPVPTWLLGDLVDVLGAGVVAVTLDEARKEETAMPQLTPLYDGLEAEVALHQGDTERALRLAQKSLEGLPKAEAIFEARVAAVGAEAARRSGDRAKMASLFERAMQKDPGVIRRLGLAIPARVKPLGSDAAISRAVTLLERSPRLEDASGAFQITIERGPKGLKACLLSPQGAQMSCTEAARAQEPVLPDGTPAPAGSTAAPDGKPLPTRPESEDDWAAHLVEQFHKNAFAMRFGLTQVDLNSLDGSTTLAGQAQREKMQEALTEMAKEGAQ